MKVPCSSVRAVHCWSPPLIQFRDCGSWVDDILNLQNQHQSSLGSSPQESSRRAGVICPVLGLHIFPPEEKKTCFLTSKTWPGMVKANKYHKQISYRKESINIQETGLLTISNPALILTCEDDCLLVYVWLQWGKTDQLRVAKYSFKW